MAEPLAASLHSLESLGSMYSISNPLILTIYSDDLSSWTGRNLRACTFFETQSAGILCTFIL